jgi:hypothetical protein
LRLYGHFCIVEDSLTAFSSFVIPELAAAESSIHTSDIHRYLANHSATLANKPSLSEHHLSQFSTTSHKTLHSNQVSKINIMSVQEMPQPKLAVLLRSKGGLSLPTEICLKIVEEVIAADPKVGTWAVMNVSKVSDLWIIHKKCRLN